MVSLPVTRNLVTGLEAQSPSSGWTSNVPDIRLPLKLPENGVPAFVDGHGILPVGGHESPRWRP